MPSGNRNPVFDYRALRLLVGIIAFLLPIAVPLIASTNLTSISASYYTNSRDIFVGMLFIVGSFLWAYNGHSTTESVVSKIAGVAAVVIAICPTACDTCDANSKSYIHYGAAVTLFLLLAYFCFGPFRKNTRNKPGKKGLRSKIYFTCGCVMLFCMLGAGISRFALSKETMDMLDITYWAETFALFAFGAAWIVAGKYIRFLVDKDEKLYLLKK
jgi:hypothetical protein